ncbi:MAG: hypothetical protein A2Y81_00795 [Nitrospirae bacterium RBG_13_43_8]|nr:MAG: hypothetical protein A2Y81_00795 [Nitrospirae bacterium RBG_13_43_8]
MKYQVLDIFKVKTSTGELELQTGQIITLPYDKAIRLLNEGKITPIERIAYKVWSEILQAYLWVVDTDHDMHSLRSQKVSEAIYAADEIGKLKGIDIDSLKVIHKAKEVFQHSKVEEINKSDNR